MCESFKHYHCALCGESYPTQEAAKHCFWDHTELEILRWVAVGLVAAHHFAGTSEGTLSKDDLGFSAEFVKEINKRFQVAEIDENGWVWSRAIKGKCV